MKTSHTPGPWFLKNGNEIHDRDTFFDASGAQIGNTPNLIATVEDFSHWDSAAVSQLPANARLIAAAPELLDALRETLRALETHIDLESKRTNISPSGICPCTLNEVARAHALITKITGGQE